jgi:superfamily I DNA/RNA helicase
MAAQRIRAFKARPSVVAAVTPAGRSGAQTSIALRSGRRGSGRSFPTSVHLGFLNQIAPLGKDIAQAKQSGVRFVSMAGSKGFTVEATIVVGCEQGLIPRPDRDLSEERRLLYVAMTRARRFLYCTWARRRGGPTARSGDPTVGSRRTVALFLDHGPLETQDGDREKTLALTPLSGP